MICSWDVWPHEKFLGGPGTVTIVSVTAFGPSFFLISDGKYENPVPA